MEMVNPKRNTHHTQAHITSHHITHAQAQGRKEGTKARTDGGREVNIAIDRGKGKDKEKKRHQFYKFCIIVMVIYGPLIMLLATGQETVTYLPIYSQE